MSEWLDALADDRPAAGQALSFYYHWQHLAAQRAQAAVALCWADELGEPGPVSQRELDLLARRAAVQLRAAPPRALAVAAPLADAALAPILAAVRALQCDKRSAAHAAMRSRSALRAVNCG